MSAQSGCDCSAARAAAQQGTLPNAPSAAITDSRQDDQCPCPSSSAVTSPARSEQADTTAQQGQTRKSRKRKGATGVYAKLKGCEVDVPGWVFGVEVPELYYRGRVLGKDPAHSGCVVLRTEDGGRYFFPVPEVTGWLEDMQRRSSPQPGSTLGTACDRFAAETLASMSMSTAAVSEGSAGEDDAGTPARDMLRQEAEAAARRALLAPHPQQQQQQGWEEEGAEEQQEGLQQRQQRQQQGAGKKRGPRKQQQDGAQRKAGADKQRQQQQQQQQQGAGRGESGVAMVVVDASGALVPGAALGQHELAGKRQQGELGKRKRGPASRRRGGQAAVERVVDSEAGAQ